jgi:hypothetical protein
MADAEGGTGEEGATPPFVTRWLPRVVIGAVRLGEDLDWDAVAAWCGGEHGLQPLTDSGEYDGLITVDGLDGTEDAYDGDWIVRHTEGFRVWTAADFASAFASAPLPPDAQPGRTAPSTGDERGAEVLINPVTPTEATSSKGIRVTCTDLDTGESESQVIWNDYVLVCAGSCYRHHVQVTSGGRTHIITVKGRRERSDVV